MAICTVEPGTLSGRLCIPPSKSMGHRALFCAALADGDSHIDNFVLSEDMHATLGVLKALGVKTEVLPSDRFQGRKQVLVHGTGTLAPTGELCDCHESGSTARFVIPFSRLVPNPVTVTGRNGLLERPFGLYRNLFAGKGVSLMDHDGRLPVVLEGTLQSGVFRMKGNVSSQFITGLLFVLPVLSGDSEILIEGKLESAPYVEMTLEMLRTFGVRARLEPSKQVSTESTDGIGARLLIPGGQTYQPVHHDVEGDWSQAAFWVVAGALGHRISLEGLRLDSLQGDRAVVALLQQMGAKIHLEANGLQVGDPAALQAIDMDVSQCPDLVPALAVAAAHAHGTTRIRNAARLRIKESDRLAAVRAQLEAMGGQVVEEPDGLLITGRPEGLTGGFVQGCNDHRIVMATAIAATRADGSVAMTDREAVRKSYPDFWTDFFMLGGKMHEQPMG